MNDWQGCTLVNPLCPDDLCILPEGHEGYHQLGTMVEPQPLSRFMVLAPTRHAKSWSRPELIEFGYCLEKCLIETSDE